MPAGAARRGPAARRVSAFPILLYLSQALLLSQLSPRRGLVFSPRLAQVPLSSNCHACGISSSAASQLLLHLGIKRVTDAVTEEGEGQHGDGDGDGRKDAEMPVRPQVLLILSHHLPPGRGGRVDPHPD